MVDDDTTDVLDEGVFEFDEDITDVEVPPPFPVGKYLGEITSSVFQNSKSSGKRMLVLDWLIPTDEYKDYPVEFEPEGIRLTTYHVLDNKPRTKVRTRELCDKVGVTYSSKLIAGEFLTKNAILEIGHEKDLEGNPVARVARIHAVNS